MTMQRGDYARVSESLRAEFDLAITDAKDDEATTTLINDIFGELALRLATAFHTVNRRFGVERFLIDCLGPEVGRDAFDDYKQDNNIE